MLSTIWHPWEENRIKGEVKAENQVKDYKKKSYFRRSATTCLELLRLFSQFDSV